MARPRLVAVVALLVAVALPQVGSAARSGDRVLVVLGTAGARPYAVEEVQQVARSAGAFLRAASFGKVDLQFDVTPWLPAFPSAPGCGGWSDRSLEGIVAPARNAAQSAGYAIDEYGRVIYAVADSHCAFHGITWGRQVMLTREPDAQLLVHELGHTFGLGHAQASSCALHCTIDETGDPFSPMGEGMTDFSAYEKAVLGWIGPQPHARASGRYLLAPAGLASTKAQALVVDAADGQWWFEYRLRPARGIVARFVDLANAPPPYVASARLILDPIRAGRPWIAPGETFRPGGFKVRVVRARQNGAELRLTWLGGRRLT